MKLRLPKMSGKHLHPYKIIGSAEVKALSPTKPAPIKPPKDTEKKGY